MAKDHRSEIKDWVRMWFKENKVWMATDATGLPVSKDGKVLIKYQMNQDYEYWVNKKNVLPLDTPPTKALAQKKKEILEIKLLKKRKKLMMGYPGMKPNIRIKSVYLPMGLLPGIQGLPELASCCVTGNMKRRSQNILGIPPTTLRSLRPSKPDCLP